MVEAKMPNLENAELSQINESTKNFQAFMDVLKQSKKRVRTAESTAIRLGIEIKKEEFRAYINYETMAKLFFDIVDERHPSPDKLKQLTSRLIDPFMKSPLENIHLKIIVLTMVRDTIKEVSPLRLYRSIQHRDDLYLATIDALEDLEDQLQEIEEQMMKQEQE